MNQIINHNAFEKKVTLSTVSKPLDDSNDEKVYGISTMTDIVYHCERQMWLMIDIFTFIFTKQMPAKIGGLLFSAQLDGMIKVDCLKILYKKIPMIFMLFPQAEYFITCGISKNNNSISIYVWPFLRQRSHHTKGTY